VGVAAMARAAAVGVEVVGQAAGAWAEGWAAGGRAVRVAGGWATVVQPAEGCAATATASWATETAIEPETGAIAATEAEVMASSGFQAVGAAPGRGRGAGCQRFRRRGWSLASSSAAGAAWSEAWGEAGNAAAGEVAGAAWDDGA